MSHQRGPGSVGKPIRTLLLLGLLAGIAAGVFLKQFYYDSETPTNAATQRVGSQAGRIAMFQTALPEGILPAGRLETFGRETLANKINGKAELYLPAGFRQLDCQRFKLANDSEAYLELFAYDMDTMRNAFAVYTAQRRPGAEPIELGEFAYEAANAVYFVQGKYYVEIVASSVSQKISEAILSLGRRFAETRDASGQVIEELAWFPQAGLDGQSISLIATNAFGFSRLDGIFTADYDVDGHRAQAFLSARQSPQAAVELVEAYAEFLLAVGGKELPSPEAIASARLIELSGAYELFFARGRVLAGVRECSSPAAATELAVRLGERLGEVAK